MGNNDNKLLAKEPKLFETQYRGSYLENNKRRLARIQPTYKYYNLGDKIMRTIVCI